MFYKRREPSFEGFHAWRHRTNEVWFQVGWWTVRVRVGYDGLIYKIVKRLPLE